MDALALNRQPATYDASTSEPRGFAASRINSLDIVRGIVMVLMAIDHVRVYSAIPAGGPTAGVFFTRWITHFCAPAFVFLAGTGAYLHGRKLADAGALARYLVTRGLMLVVLELTVIRFSWTFNVAYADFTLAGVIWMLGWCMVLLAALVRLPARTVGLIGVGIMLFQQIFALIPRAFPGPMRSAVGGIWEFIYPAGLDRFPGINILYVLVPWIGVMAAGYGFGAIMLREAPERRKLCLTIGLTATALFLIIAGVFTALGAPPGEERPALFRLLDQNKYPASQLYLLMTLGPTIALLPFLEGARGKVADLFSTFGRVPMFYYLLHIPLIHVTALAVNALRDGATHAEWYARAPFVWVEDESARWGLGLLYLVFIIDVAILYLPCRWYARLKAERAAPWLRYL